MSKRKPTLRERGITPQRSEVARQMVTSGLYHSRQVPNRKRQADRLACRRPQEA